MDTASQLLLGQASAATATGADRAANSGLGSKTASVGNSAQAQGSRDSHSEYSQSATGDKPFAEHMADAAQPVKAVNKSSSIATPHFDFSQEVLLANGLTPTMVPTDGGNSLQFAGELLPGLLPQSMAGWTVPGQAATAEAGGTEATQLNTTAAGGQGLPGDLEQQIAWQTPAGVNAQAGDAAGTLAAGSAAAAPLAQQSAQAQGMVTIMSNLKQQGTAANGAALADPQALAEQWLDGESITSSLSGQQKSSAGQLSGDASLQASGLNQGLAAKPLAAQGAGSNVGLGVGAGQNSEALLAAANATALSLESEPGSAVAEKVSASLATLSTAYPKVEGGGSYVQAASPAFQTTVSTPVMAQGWGDTVMQRVMWMSSQQIHSAEIQLDPPELGSLMVKINSSHEQTSVSFTSPHAAVRDALDQNLPKLRELMAEQGLDNVNVDVSEHSRQDKAEQGDEEGAQGGLLAQQDDEAGLDAQPESAATVEELGLINAYA